MRGVVSNAQKILRIREFFEVYGYATELTEKREKCNYKF